MAESSNQPRDEGWLLSLYDRAPLGLFRSDENWVLTEANPQLARILGYGSVDEVIGKSLAALVIDREKLLDLPSILREKGVVDAYRVRARRRDGAVVWLSLYCALSEEGDRWWIDGLAIDFTQRKLLGDELRREKRSYQRLVTSLPGIVYTATLNGDASLVFVSPQVKTILGVSYHEVLSRGGFFKGLVHPKDEETLKSWLESLVGQEGRSVVPSIEIRMVDSKGDLRWFRNMATVEDEEGVLLVHGVMFETTELRRVEEELRHAQKMESLGRMVAGITHDFKNVLTAIMGFAEMGMEETPRESTQHHYFSVIMEQGEKASSLIQKLLDFARRREPVMEPVNTATMLKGVAEVLRRTFPKNIEIELKIDGDIPFVKCEEVQMEQVLLNLAINARDAMPQGGRLILSASRVEIPPTSTSSIPPGHYVKIVVEDTGTGMSPQVLERATEPFFTTKKRGIGTGLGLSQAVGIVRSHGGHFFLESEEGEGTRAIIYLPALLEFLSSDEKEVEEESTQEVFDHNHQPSVLVVDDEREIRAFLAVALESAGFRVYSAADGQEAWEFYQILKNKPDLVITDMVMPRMGGKEFIEKLREADPDLPILAISGYASSFSLENLGVERVEVLSKPITKRVLLDAVNRLLKRS